MTVARPLSPSSRLRMPAARLELAWTASARAMGAVPGYASAALRMEVEWDPSDAAGAGSVRCTVDRAGNVHAVELPRAVQVRVVRRAAWAHVEVSAGGDGRTLLSASFRDGRLAYCTSDAPAAAGLPGATYDAPTGILELYDAT